MTLAKKNDLAAFQQDLVGQITNPTVDGIPISLENTESTLIIEEEEFGNDLEWEDEELVAQRLGVTSKRTEWSERLSIAHDSWLEQLPELCIAYLTFRSKTTAPEPDTDGGETISMLCIDLECTLNDICSDPNH